MKILLLFIIFGASLSQQIQVSKDLLLILQKDLAEISSISNNNLGNDFMMKLKIIGNSALFLSNCFKDVGGIINGIAEILENKSNASNEGLIRLKQLIKLSMQDCPDAWRIIFKR